MPNRSAVFVRKHASTVTSSWWLNCFEFFFWQNTEEFGQTMFRPNSDPLLPIRKPHSSGLNSFIFFMNNFTYLISASSLLNFLVMASSFLNWSFWSWLSKRSTTYDSKVMTALWMNFICELSVLLSGTIIRPTKVEWQKCRQYKQSKILKKSEPTKLNRSN